MGLHIHIIGSSPRSGTTLMNEMMVSCFAVDRHYPHERAIFRTPKPVGDELVVTKRPKDALFMVPIIESNPNLHCLFVMRDPRDVVVSRHGDAKEHYYISLAWWKLVYQRAAPLLRHPRVLVIKYEELVTDPDAAQRRIVGAFGFLAERQRHPFSEYYLHSHSSEKAKRAMNQRRQVTASSIGNWRRHKPRLAAELLQYGAIDEQLQRYGYEYDDSWKRELDGVEPIYYRSFSRNEIGWYFRLKTAIRQRAYSARYRLFC